MGLTDLTEYIPLQQGLRLFINRIFHSFYRLTEYIPLQQGLRPIDGACLLLYQISHRVYSITTRIKTSGVKSLAKDGISFSGSRIDRSMGCYKLDKQSGGRIIDGVVWKNNLYRENHTLPTDEHRADRKASTYESERPFEQAAKSISTDGRHPHTTAELLPIPMRMQPLSECASAYSLSCASNPYNPKFHQAVQVGKMKASK